jgi:hypothetical protein
MCSAQSLAQKHFAAHCVASSTAKTFSARATFPTMFSASKKSEQELLLKHLPQATSDMLFIIMILQAHFREVNEKS